MRLGCQSPLRFKLPTPQINRVATELEDSTGFAGSHTGVDGIEDFLPQVSAVSKGHNN